MDGHGVGVVREADTGSRHVVGDDHVEALALEQHLSPTRSNGLSSMLKAIRNFATEALEAA